MTIQSPTARASFVCNSVSTVFPVNIQAYLATDFLVLVTNAAGSIVLTLNSDYTLVASGSLAPPFWSLTTQTGQLVSPYVTGNTLQVILNPAETQLSQYTQGQAFPSLAVQTNLDRLTQMVIREGDQLSRAITAPDGDVNPSMLLPYASLRKSTNLGFDNVGNVAINLQLLSGTLSTATIVPFIPASVLVGILYPQTLAEIAASVTPTNFTYLEMDPRRYGAIGKGVTNDTAALNKFISVVNAYTGANPGTAPVANWPSGSNFLCSPLNAITANNFTLNAVSVTLQALPNVGAQGNLLSVSGTGFRCYGLILDGNQFATSSETYLNLLSLTGNDVLLDAVSTIRGDTRGLYISLVSGGRFINCHFDSNANLGIEVETCSYLKFVNCTTNYNGYGYKLTLATNTFVAFGFSLRYRSHHCTFVDCEALQNGRDGMNVNEGSYAVKFIGCLCWMNYDGGFTVAADNLSSGKPGDGEICYDIEYIDCEAYNNWSSGIALYANTNNVTIDGGRYYNNHLLAGDLVAAESYGAGIFVSPSSIGVRIRTKAYDDRQLCPITGHAAGVIAATGWVAGTMANYPKVALYSPAVSGPGLAFQGYGKITAESAGSVTITTTAFSGVTIASIAAGWFISQRVQHTGVLFGTGVSGSADVDAMGQLPGPNVWDGFKTYSDPSSNNQNIWLPAAQMDYTELLANPTWDAATGTGTTWNYTLTGGGAANLFTTVGALLRSVGCLQLIGGSSQASGNGTLITSGLNYISNGAWVEFGVWVYAIAPGDAQIGLTWGAGNQNTFINHPGGGWRLMKIGAYIPAGAAQLTPEVISAIGKTNYFDNAYCRVRGEAYNNLDFSYPTRNLPV